MVDLATFLNGMEAEGGGWSVDAPAAWSQGRTLYGGASAALCVAAAARALPDLPPLRSAQLAFVGPGSGRLSIEVELVRRGRSSATVAARIDGGAGPATRSILTYAAARESGIGYDLSEAPAVPAPEACRVVRRVPGTPEFIEQFEIRAAGGSRPFSGAERPEFISWVRLVSQSETDPVAALLALAYSLPPASYVRFPHPAVISTMTWSVDLFEQPRAGPWHLLRSASDQAANGYTTQVMTVWDAAGRRLAEARQLVAIFI